jgi:hypothetical protein
MPVLGAMAVIVACRIPNGRIVAWVDDGHLSGTTEERFDRAVRILNLAVMDPADQSESTHSEVFFSR